MDFILYSILKKRINGLASGVADVNVNGTNLTFFLKDGSTATMTFPAPKDGISVIDATIDERVHLILHLSDKSVVDAGPVPVAQGRPGRDGETPFVGDNGNWWLGDKDTGYYAQGDVSDLTVENAITRTFAKIPDEDIARLFVGMNYN